MRSIDPATIPASESHRYLLAGVAPRPIAFVGTRGAGGNDNLSPFSFFNAFGANPPVVAFSPAYRGTDGTPKHTFINIRESGEFTISVVSYSMVQQMNLASADWPEEVDEFRKSGFTKLPSSLIAPPGVAESPMVMECRLLQHIDLGGKASSGNLMVGEVVMFHISESAFDGPYPDYRRLDLVARMGGPYYCRANGDAVFSLAKPTELGIGFEQLPSDVQRSEILTGNDLAQLASVISIPTSDEIEEFWTSLRSAEIGAGDNLSLELMGENGDRVARTFDAVVEGGEEVNRTLRHRVAQYFVRRNEPIRAWYILLR